MTLHLFFLWNMTRLTFRIWLHLLQYMQITLPGPEFLACITITIISTITITIVVVVVVIMLHK